MNTTIISESVDSNIKAKARIFAKKNNLGTFEVQDIEQEIFIEVLKGIQSYKPRLASLETYCDRIIQNKIKKLAEKHHSNKNQMIVSAEQLKEDDTGNDSSGHNALEESLSVDFSVSFPLHVAELQSDLKTMLDKLPDELREFCMNLAKGHSLNRIAEKKKLCKYALYKKYVNPLRELCREFHLQEYLDRSAVLRNSSCF
jgi:RNA polymerase sigma factor (sigma-70 family)